MAAAICSCHRESGQCGRYDSHTMTERRHKIEYGDFQTPPALADEVCSLLHRLDVCPRTIIEPACGEGSFLEAAARVFGTKAEYFGFDINPDYIATAAQ